MPRTLSDAQYQQLQEILESAEMVIDPDVTVDEVAEAIVEVAEESGDSIGEVLDDLENEVETTTDHVEDEISEVVEGIEDDGSTGENHNEEESASEQSAESPDDASGGIAIEPIESDDSEPDSLPAAESTPDVAPKVSHWFYRKFGGK